MKRSQEVAHGFSVLPVRWPGEGLTHLTKEYSAFWMILNTPHQLHVLSVSRPLSPLDWQKAVLSFGPILLLIFNTSFGFHRPQACFHRQPLNYTLLAGSFMKASLEIGLRTMGFWLLGKRDTTGIWYFRHFFPFIPSINFFFRETTSILSLYSLSSLFCFISITYKICFSAG